MAETGVTVTVVVRRQGGVSGDVTVDYATSDGSAGAGDYVSAAGTLQWLEGDSADKTFDVTVTDDLLVEFDETVNVTLQVPTGGATLGALTTATVTILDDEVNAAPVADAGIDQSVQESDTVYLDGTGSYDPDSGPGALTFSWQQTSGTAVTLTGASTASPSFTAPNVSAAPEVLTFELTVSDGELSGTDPIAVTVTDTPTGTTRGGGGCTFESTRPGFATAKPGYALTTPGGLLLACLLLAALASLLRRRPRPGGLL